MKPILFFFCALMMPVAAYAEIQPPFSQNSGRTTRQADVQQHPFNHSNPFATNTPNVRTQSTKKFNRNTRPNGFKLNGDQNNAISRKAKDEVKAFKGKTLERVSEQDGGQVLQRGLKKEIQKFTGNN